MTDLYDEPRPPGSRWTRVNIGEAIPGVPTPLSWSIWRPAMEHAFWWAQEQLGVVGRREPRPRVTGIALGRPCVSVDVSLAQVARIPGYDVDAFAEQYFGVAAGPAPTLDPSPGPDPSTSVRARGRDLARLGARAPLGLATIGRRTRANGEASAAWWDAAVHGPQVAEPVALLDEAARRFAQAMAVHTLQGIACQGAYERAGALAEDLAARLVSSDGDLAEARLAADLWAVAHGERTEAAFLADHGFHGPDEGELAARSWREDPEPVRAAVAAWSGADPGRSPTAAAARRTADRAAAQAELLARLPLHRRPAARLVLRVACRLVADREVGKAAFLRHLDVARLAARQLGDDAPWCTLDELRRGARPTTAEVEERRQRRAELLGIDLPLTWVGDPTPLPAAPAPRPAAAPTHLTVVASATVDGVGASPGTVVGRARVVTDPAALVEPIGPDEVLVTRTTDPSWVTLFLTAGALVIDVGGALSHGAIIARELGIPCVIGTGDGTARIPDGAEVAVDGTTGRVTLR